MSDAGDNLYRAIEVDFSKTADDDTLLCSAFRCHGGDTLLPYMGEVVAVYDDEISMFAQVLWCSGGQVEVELLHDYGDE